MRVPPSTGRNSFLASMGSGPETIRRSTRRFSSYSATSTIASTFRPNGPRRTSRNRVPAPIGPSVSWVTETRLGCHSASLAGSVTYANTSSTGRSTTTVSSTRINATGERSSRSLAARTYNACMADHHLPERDRPWVMRTYAGHSDARRSNELYRRNLAKGQTGLSIAFDLPTQTGYDPDHVLARGEVGKVGVSVAHRGDMETLLDQIPLDTMNTSMTINATAAWLLGLYAAVAEEQGVALDKLSGTTQNDIIKEYLSRGTYAFPPEPSMRLIADMVAFTVNEIPKWNPINICSYHLQEAGATPIQEIAYALSTAIAVLDEVKARGQVSEQDFPKVFGRISFFVNAGVRFIEEHAKLRAMGVLWEELGLERYGVTEPKYLRMRYGVQVNSLGLTEAQPENNVPRIVLEALAVTLGRDARARAIQLPAWNEALGLPRPWDQQWSLRIQQILAEETDILEYPDIFDGSKVMDGLVAELTEGAGAEMAIVEEHGGAVAAVPYMKARLVESHRERVARIEAGEQK